MFRPCPIIHCHAIKAAVLCNHKAMLLGTLQRQRAILQHMESTKTEIDSIALTKGQKLAAAGAVLLTAQTGTLFYWTYSAFDWNLVEPITYLLGYSVVWLTILLYFTTGRDFTYEELMHMATERARMDMYSRRGLDMDAYRRVHLEVAELTIAIDRLREVNEKAL